MCKRIAGYIKKRTWLSNTLVILGLAILIGSVVLISFFEFPDLWSKVFATCYVTAALILVVLIGLPATGDKIGFKNKSFWSFITWCVIVPVMVGVLITGLSVIFFETELEKIGIWILSIIICLFSLIWFLKAIKGKRILDYLDLYSTIWIAAITIITTQFDLLRNREAIVVLLLVYLSIQIIIKYEHCKETVEK